MSDWRELNRANWDERVAMHLGGPGYGLAPLRAGQGRLNAIEEAELVGCACCTYSATSAGIA